MPAGKRVLAVIPARGGSKGVPRKNIALLAGRPLVSYTIEAAGAATMLDLTIVSTEDPEIKAIAEQCGARVVDRPAELAADTARTEPVLLHALDALESAGEAPFDFVVVIEPTSPLRSAATIDACVTQLMSSGAVSLLTVRETRENVGTLDDGMFTPLSPGAPRRRQDRRPFFIESSTVYVCEVAHLRATGSLVAQPWAAYVVPPGEAHDINTVDDFAHVEFLMRRRMD